MTLPAGGGPTERRLHVILSGLARPGPVNPGLLPGLAPEGGPGFPCPGEVTVIFGSLFMMGSLNRS